MHHPAHRYHHSTKKNPNDSSGERRTWQGKEMTRVGARDAYGMSLFPYFIYSTDNYLHMDRLYIQNGTITTSRQAHHHHHQRRANSQQRPATTAQRPHRVTTSPHHCQQPLHRTVQRARHHGTTMMAMTTVTAHSRGFLFHLLSY